MIKVDGEEVVFKKFNDGSLRLDYIPPDDEPVITWLYNNDEEISQLFFLTNMIRRQWGFQHVLLEMPYINSARMDRIKKPSECFSLKYFCEFINSLKFNKVYVFDPHSAVSTALLNRVQVEMPNEEISFILNKYPNALLFFPDEGAYKRYHSYFEVPTAFGIKERNWETQKIESLRIAGAQHMIAGHDIIICDDILSRGSTLYFAAKALKELGARNIYVWVSHCENTVLRPNINGKSLLDIPDLITKVYTKNSIFTGNNYKI